MGIKNVREQRVQCERPSGIGQVSVTTPSRLTARVPRTVKRVPVFLSHYATALARAHCDQISVSAEINRLMSASLCTGEGVMRRRSVPRGTVG